MGNIQSIRQSNLFAAEDWRTIYRAFNEINFAAYDFDTIKQSLVEYMRTNFPEDFNDWVESSEFVAIIDMLAYLGQSLAFRMDLNSRENFIDAAERRQSLLRLARLLSFQPQRNYAASGFAKLISIETNDSIIDSTGANLSNIEIIWNNSADPSWYEKWVAVMNEVLSNSNLFGNPLKQENILGVPTQLYKMENATTAIRTYPFNINADGLSLPFEIVNPDISSSDGIFERSPNPDLPFHILYRNDGNGNSSTQTGFFVYFKQGSLSNSDFILSNPVENRLLNVDIPNINQTDVHVQSVQDNGIIIKEWTKVPALVGSNVIYNDIQKEVRDIFSVHTLPNDQIAIRFGDGRFGNIPTGPIRVWHRQSANREYSIRPSNMRQVPISFTYTNSNNQVRTITFKFSLQEEVSNSTTSQDIEEIRRRAPQVYYTQNRMVSGEDYNVFPLSSSRALKIKAINRTFSGHSIYIDHNDPTGSFQNVKIFSNDGILYQDNDYNLKSIFSTDNLSSSEIITTIVQPFMRTSEFNNDMLNNHKNVILRAKTAKDNNVADSNANIQALINLIPTGDIIWKKSTSALYSSSGSFYSIAGTSYIAVSQNTPALRPQDILDDGALVKFKKAGWVSISNVLGSGASKGSGFQSNGQGNIILNQNVDDGDVIELIIPPLNTTLTSSEMSDISTALGQSTSFALYYDLLNRKWNTISEPVNGFSLLGVWEYQDIINGRGWMVNFNRENAGSQIWSIRARELNYVFESKKDVRFYNPNVKKLKDPVTGLVNRDSITVLGTNAVPSATNLLNWSNTSTYATGDKVVYQKTIYQATTIPTVGSFIDSQWAAILPALGNDYKFAITKQLREDNGILKNRNIGIQPFDTDDDGVVDSPTSFEDIVLEEVTDPLANKVFFQRFTNLNGNEEYKPVSIEREFRFANTADMTAHYIANSAKWTDGKVAYVAADSNGEEQWYIFDLEGGSFNITGATPNPKLADKDQYRSAVGRENIHFMWQHYATNEQRIDPAATNVIDIHVLTSEYDEAIRRLIFSQDDTLPIPTPPTETDLKQTFNILEVNKMISDQIVWKPAKYRLLFGPKSENALKASFRAIKLPVSSLSDGELRARILDAINEYFALENWDFGETFFATELIAYIHQSLATDLASIVIVPNNEESVFGNLFEIPAQPDEIFISNATINDIEIINNLTETTLRVNK